MFRAIKPFPCLPSLKLPFSSSALGFKHVRSIMNDAPTPSQGPIFAVQDEARASRLRSSLAKLTGDGGLWMLSTDGKGINRDFRFKTFRAASAFMSVMIGKIAEERHHPFWSNQYSHVHVLWSTHKDKQSGLSGISELDITMAKMCDKVALDVTSGTPSVAEAGSVS